MDERLKILKIETDESARGKIFINWPDHNFKKEVDFEKGQTEQKQFFGEIIQIREKLNFWTVLLENSSKTKHLVKK